MRIERAARARLLLVAVGVTVAGISVVHGQTSSANQSGPRLARQSGLPAGAAIGASVRDVTEAERQQGTLHVEGAIVENVRDESPAARGGLQPDDLIVELDGERVRSARQLGRLVSETPVGRSVKAVVVRDGERMDLELTPGMRPDVVVPGAAMGRFERFGRDLRTVLPQFELPEFELPEFDVRVRRPSGRLGVSVHQMSPQLAEFFDVRTGVLVTEVAEDSPAAKSGVKAGDVITAIDGWTI